MTNEIRTRRLIVTLPNVSGEEAEGIAYDLEHHEGNWREVLFGSALAGDVTAEPALDDAPLDNIRIKAYTDRAVMIYDDLDNESIYLDEPDKARKLAALLWRAADEAEAQR